MTLYSFRKLLISPWPIHADWYALPLRLIVGYGFFSHGYAKLARGPEHFVAILQAIGLPFAELLGWATVIVELVGGVMILLGAFIPLAAVPMIVVLLVAIFTVHLPNGFSSIKLTSYDAAGAHFGQPGYETDALYMAGLLALCIAGAGPISLDAYLSARREGKDLMSAPPVLRVARPGDDLDALLSFYRDGLGLDLLYRFENHDGFDGVMLGRRGAPYHLEFTRAHGHRAGRAPSQDHLLVFYHPEPESWRDAITRLRAAGFEPVAAFNPYWEGAGATFEDPDGYRVVLQQSRWEL